jgi:hypothetical protein
MDDIFSNISKENGKVEVSATVQDTMASSPWRKYNGLLDYKFGTTALALRLMTFPIFLIGFSGLTQHVTGLTVAPD